MYDCIVVGGGIAGLYVALLAQRHGRVLLLTKAGLNDSNTYHAQGGIAAAVGALDHPELHWQDTLVAGAGLCDPAAAWVLAREGPAAIADLIRFGVPFDGECGQPALAREGAHSRARVLHAGGDATGRHIQTTLGHLVQESSNVVVREHHLVTDLAVEAGVVGGVVALDCRAGRTEWHRGRSVVLASGGVGQLYPQTTNPPVATGSGLAIAYRAGAGVADLEFCQFHPTALQLPGAPRFLISEAARGEGGVLLDADGHRFMTDYDPQGELAPRHVVAEAILSEMARHGAPCVYLDLSHLPASQILERFPTIAAYCWQYELDITTTPIPVAPAAHYMMGGVRTNLWGETDLPNLFACGEVACTGVHGANRLASNSLLEALVFGSRLVRRLTGRCHELAPEESASGTVRGFDQYPPVSGPAGFDASLISPVREEPQIGPPAAQPEAGWRGEPSLSPVEPPARGGQPVQLEQLQHLMWTAAGMRRSRQPLANAERQLARWAAALPAPGAGPEHELRDLLLVGRLVVAAALLREETRGAHHRLDFPSEDVAWRRRHAFHVPRRAPSAVEAAPAIHCAP